ncbi:MAG TPA: prepilin-type N-terminal cleavage/methylation domain-containing protein [Bacilli bacterium]|nr:prepilin-type N-terminal cleavage/methylation domain-containing protein [Bacilli bacterium]
MNKKGFTLIELLAVLALLSLLTIITIPIINSRKTAINTKEYNALVDSIKSAAKIYISNNPQVLNGVNDTECINTVTIDTLQTEKLLEDNLTSPIDNSTIDGVINICVNGDDLTYEFPYSP